MTKQSGRWAKEYMVAVDNERGPHQQWIITFFEEEDDAILLFVQQNRVFGQFEGCSEDPGQSLVQQKNYFVNYIFVTFNSLNAFARK